MTANNHQYLITGGEDPFRPKLISDINSAERIDITVSFIRQSGLRLILDALIDALDRGVEMRILTGDYLNVTEPMALRHLLLLQESGADIRIFETRGKQSFHMKAYIFTFSDEHGEKSGHAYVGSSNLSSSALNQGLEWNLRVELEENPSRFAEICRKFEAIYFHENTQRLSNDWIASYQKKFENQPVFLFPELEPEEPLLPPEPNALQQAALQALKQTRDDGYKRGLVVMATGLGKTWLAAFDSVQLASEKVLFVAHREEILTQAEYTFVRIRPEDKVARYSGLEHQLDADMLFASIQTLGKTYHLHKFAADHFDYIVVDEFHHASARTYGHLDANRHFIAQATGNSMDGGKNPIQDGDYLLFEIITPDNAGSISNQIVAIERQDISGGDQYLLRYVRKRGPGQYDLIANNPDYQTMPATDDLRTFARMKAVIDSDDLKDAEG